MKKLILILFFFILLNTSHAQQHFSSLEVPSNMRAIRGMMVGEDIFLSIEWPSGDLTTMNTSYFIKPDGSNVEIDMSRLVKKAIIGGVRRGDRTQFYYLDEMKDIVSVHCLEIGPSGEKKDLSDTVEVPGKIYGSYTENGSLYMLCALKKDFTLKLLQLQDGKLVNETTFSLSYDLGKKKETNVSFYHAAPHTTPKQASAPVKIVKDGNNIWITIDEPMMKVDLTLTESSIFKTTVIKLDLLTGKTAIKAFYETQRDHFTSTVVGGDVYRLVFARPVPRIDQFNFESGKKVKTANLVRGNDPARDSTYAHIGTNLKTEKDVKKAYVVKRVIGNLFIVDSLSGNEKILTIGHYGDQVDKFISPMTVVGLVLTAASLTFSELYEGPYSCVYYYYKGSMDTGFTETYRTPLLRQVVDEYEYNLMINKVRFDYKGYLYDNDITYGFYKKKKSATVDIIKFQK